jgi:alkanesulfonate monooxygenase SsuD/methylene tetrahydromethanopterin reductase-like flavin-dependent oxidoreductase (luciferase family)
MVSGDGESVGTGISVVPVNYWTAPRLAATAGTVGGLSCGRFALGVGTGSAYVERAQRPYGQPAYPPVALMRDYVTTLRALLAGEKVEYTGQTVTLSGIQLGFTPPRVPVHLGALGPQMLRLAGEVADGACLNWCAPEQVAWSRRRLAEGASRPARRRRSADGGVHPGLRGRRRERRPARTGAGDHGLRSWPAPAHSKDQGYRATSPGWASTPALSELEARRDAGAPRPS